MGLDSGTRDYLFGISDVVTKAEGHPADGEILIENTLSEIEGKEVDVILDVRAGRYLEVLVPLFSVPRDITKLIDALSNAPHSSIVDVFANSSSSHVLESIMKRCMDGITAPPTSVDPAAAPSGKPHNPTESKNKKAPATEEEKKSWSALWHAFEVICGHLSTESWAEAACDANGCHAIRTLFVLLSRCAASPDEGISQGQACSVLFTSVAGLIASLCTNISYAVTNAHSSPTIGAALDAMDTVVRAHPIHEEYLALIVARLIDAMKEGGVLKSSTKDAVGSRLMEIIIRTSPKQIQSDLYGALFSGDELLDLSKDRSGNHVVQALLAAPNATPENITKLVQALLPHVGMLFTVGDRVGVVMQMADACARCSVCETEFVDALQSAISKNKSEGSKGANLGGAAFATGVLGSSPFPQYLRSRIAQALLRMGKNVARNFAGSLTQLPSDFLIQLAGNQSGSHIIEAALKCKTIPSSMQEKLISKLSGSFANLARSSQGSHVVELCYARSDTKMKEAIAQELADSEETLASDRYGRFVLRTCKVSLFREKKEAWKSHVSSAETARNLFREFLEDNEATDKTASSSVISSTKQSDSDEEAIPGGRDAFLALLGMTEEVQQRVLAQVSGAKKSKRKKPKKDKKKETAEETSETTEEKTANGESVVDEKTKEEEDALKNSIIDALKGANKKKKGKKRSHDDEEAEAEGIEKARKKSKKSHKDEEEKEDD